jgi:hypothetical protein
VLLGSGLIVVGVAFIAASRFFAAAFGLGDDATTRLLGFGDDVASRYRRGAVAVVIGLACIAGGVAVVAA